MAYNGCRQGPGQLWAARAGQGREKERLDPGQARAIEKERTQSNKLQYCITLNKS